MGTQKLLLPFHGRTVIEQVVDAILAAGIGQVFVVVGQDGAQIAQALAGRAVHLVANPDAAGDMLSSVRCGWRALPAECAAVLVALGDQPMVGAALIRQVLRAYARPGRFPLPLTFHKNKNRETSTRTRLLKYFRWRALPYSHRP